MNLQYYKNIVRNYQSEFEFFKSKVFPIVMQWEGGGKLHNVAGDSGGFTIWGLTWNNLKSLFTNFDDFKDTTRDEASYIAFVKYYLPIQADKMPYDTKLYYFDMAYNMGTSRAIKIMQKCAGVKADGIIGAITISQMHKVTETALKTEREKTYNQLVAANRTLSKFLKGWFNRSKSIFDFRY